MRKIALLTFIIVFGSTMNAQVYKGAYFGLKPPSLVSAQFAPDLISTEAFELNSVFSPDSKEFLFTRVLNDIPIIMITRLNEVGWSKPEPISFSGEYLDVDPIYSLDGNYIYFGSKRPVKGTKPKEWQIWVSKRELNGWGEPVHLAHPINIIDKKSVYPSLSANSTMFFQSDREGGHGETDIYFSEIKDGKFSEPVNPGAPINSAKNDGDVFIAPDESYVIITSEREGGYGEADLYISFKQEDGSWSGVHNLGPKVNNELYNFCPVVSPDGKYFFYTTNGDIYWIDFEMLLKEVQKDL